MLVSFILVLILILGLIVIIIGQKYYQFNPKYICIKSSKKILSPQELMILFGSICCSAIPFLIATSLDSDTCKQILNDILADPIVTVLAILMILCPILISIIAIYIVVSNLIKSRKSDFVRKVIFDNTFNYIKVYYYNNNVPQIIPFCDVESFNIRKTKIKVPNIRPSILRAGLNLGTYICGTINGNVEIVTDIEIIISTVNNEEIKINTIGNPIFDADSGKLLSAINRYKTDFKNFCIQ